VNRAAVALAAFAALAVLLWYARVTALLPCESLEPAHRRAQFRGEVRMRAYESGRKMRRPVVAAHYVRVFHD
jgi:hypothetical protein